MSEKLREETTHETCEHNMQAYKVKAYNMLTYNVKRNECSFDGGFSRERCISSLRITFPCAMRLGVTGDVLL